MTALEKLRAIVAQDANPGAPVGWALLCGDAADLLQQLDARQVEVAGLRGALDGARAENAKLKELQRSVSEAIGPDGSDDWSDVFRLLEENKP